MNCAVTINGATSYETTVEAVTPAEAARAGAGAFDHTVELAEEGMVDDVGLNPAVPGIEDERLVALVAVVEEGLLARKDCGGGRMPRYIVQIIDRGSAVLPITHVEAAGPAEAAAMGCEGLGWIASDEPLQPSGDGSWTTTARDKDGAPGLRAHVEVTAISM